MPAPGFRPVQALTLAAGSWTVVAKAFAVDLSGGGDIVRCQIFDGTHAKALDAAAATVKPDYPGSMNRRATCWWKRQPGSSQRRQPTPPARRPVRTGDPG